MAFEEKVVTAMDEEELEEGKGGEQESDEEDESAVGVPETATLETAFPRARLLFAGRSLSERGFSHSRNCAGKFFFERGASRGLGHRRCIDCEPLPWDIPSQVDDFSLPNEAQPSQPLQKGS